MEELNQENVNSTSTQPSNNEPIKSTTTTKEVKVYDEDYVKRLKDESINRRLKLDENEKVLKETLGVDFDSLGTVKEKLDKLNILEAQQKAVEQKLLDTELKLLSEKYNTKLLNAVLDKSKISFENLEIKGLEEHIKELETEFPEILKKPEATGQNLNPSQVNSSRTEHQEAMDKVKNNKIKTNQDIKNIFLAREKD